MRIQSIAKVDGPGLNTAPLITLDILKDLISHGLARLTYFPLKHMGQHVYFWYSLF